MTKTLNVIDTNGRNQGPAQVELELREDGTAYKVTHKGEEYWFERTGTNIKTGAPVREFTYPDMDAVRVWVDDAHTTLWED